MLVAQPIAAVEMINAATECLAAVRYMLLRLLPAATTFQNERELIEYKNKVVWRMGAAPPAPAASPPHRPRMAADSQPRPGGCAAEHSATERPTASAATSSTTIGPGSCGLLQPDSWRHHTCSGSCLQAVRCAAQCARWHLRGDTWLSGRT